MSSSQLDRVNMNDYRQAPASAVPLPMALLSPDDAREDIESRFREAGDAPKGGIMAGASRGTETDTGSFTENFKAFRDYYESQPDQRTSTSQRQQQQEQHRMPRRPSTNCVPFPLPLPYPNFETLQRARPPARGGTLHMILERLDRIVARQNTLENHLEAVSHDVNEVKRALGVVAPGSPSLENGFASLVQRVSEIGAAVNRIEETLGATDIVKGVSAERKGKMRAFVSPALNTPSFGDGSVHKDASLDSNGVANNALDLDEVIPAVSTGPRSEFRKRKASPRPTNPANTGRKSSSHSVALSSKPPCRPASQSKKKTSFSPKFAAATSTSDGRNSELPLSGAVWTHRLTGSGTQTLPFDIAHLPAPTLLPPQLSVTPAPTAVDGVKESLDTEDDDVDMDASHSTVLTNDDCGVRVANGVFAWRVQGR